ncbi:MAG: aminotransferase class III-fold pyridoxal phosphate-dependent enzyme, partial [Gammaproteobacteria bacterium]
MGDHLMSSYQYQPVAFAHGAGAWLTDMRGQRYLDALSGIAVCGLGHAHPIITQTIAHQAGQLLHTSNLYH